MFPSTPSSLLSLPQGLKFGQGKDLFSSVPALINFFKTAVSKKKDPVAAPASFSSTSASSATPQSSNSDNRNNGNNNNSKSASQNNGNASVPVKRVSRFAPLASTAVQISNSSESFHSILKKLNQKATERKDEGPSQAMDMDMEIDAQYGSYGQPPVPPRGVVPPPPLPPSMSSHSSQFQPPPQYY